MNGMIIWTPGVTLENIEQQVIEKAFEFFRGNKTATANALGLSVRTIDTKLEKYAADRDAEGQKHERAKRDREDFQRRQRGIHAGTNQVGQQITFDANRVDTNAGLRVQPAPQIPAQQPLSVQERQEVQSVSPRHVASGGSRKGR